MKAMHPFLGIMLLALSSPSPAPLDFEIELLYESEKESRMPEGPDLPPGVTPREAITGSRSGSTVGRAENPWDTRGKPRREDGYD